MTHVVLSLGSNIEREKNIRFAVNEIQNRFGALEISPVYETASVGFEGPPFLNLVAGFCSDQDLLAVRDSLRQVEAIAGRIRGRKSFDNRVLDIDVILFGEKDFSSDFNIPRDEIHKYAYVLKPLCDLYCEAVHPVLGETYGDMWGNFDQGDQLLRPVEMTF
jgi:2-amino-4-hydroxy-6-hydroxymethyldihydropteridine diphosphokinase